MFFVGESSGKRLQSAEEHLFISDRILTSQDLEDAIVQNIESIELLECFKKAHKALWKAEDLMRGSYDLDATDPDSDGSDAGDTTLKGNTTA
ncbi:hypothetical protein C8R46DRAFT_1231004 [Mycena filopes]|nr:hypothetical protein C8R46DRAFT_1231004 [Mycena filopes]